MLTTTSKLQNSRFLHRKLRREYKYAVYLFAVKVCCSEVLSRSNSSCHGLQDTLRGWAGSVEHVRKTRSGVQPIAGAGG